MKSNLVSAALFGSLLLGTTLTAQAACITPVTPFGAYPNDVSIDGFAFELASGSPPDLALEVDMNGIQPGIEINRPWATHGTLVVLVDEAGATEWITSWTQNTYVDSVEWVCRLRLEPGTTTATGEGAVTTSVFGSGGPGAQPIKQCVLDLVNDCP